MANPTCTKASLVTSCYIVPGAINERQRKALLLRAKMYMLAAIGGTNYIGRESLMFVDSAQLTCGMQSADMDASLVHIAFVNAMAAGAPIPVGINAKITDIKCLVEATDRQLDEADVLLSCKLGVNKTYPQ